MKDSNKENFELVKQIGKGNTDAESRLYQKYRERILFFTRRKIDYLEDAEDICQNTLMSVLELAREKKIKNPDNVSSLIYKICTNKIIDYLRSKYKKMIVNLDEVGELDDELERIVKVEEKEIICAEWRKLHIRERRVLYLKYINEWNSQQIGQHLNIKPGSVRKIAERSIKKIGKKLKNTHKRNVTN